MPFAVLAGGLLVLAALAFTFGRKYLVGAKSNDGVNGLGQIGYGAVAAYERDGRLCPSVLRPVPAIDDVQRGVQQNTTGYITTKRQWDEAGFGCLGFSVETPMHHSFDYQVHGAAFVVTVWGDFGGDGKMSALGMRGWVENGVAVLEPELRKGP